MDFAKVNNVVFEGIDHTDYPDYCDAFCVYAEIEGVPLTTDELVELNDSLYWYDLLIETLN